MSDEQQEQQPVEVVRLKNPKWGGPRSGAGRRPKVQEQNIIITALAAIEKKFGSLEKGFMWLLSYEIHKDSSLVKYAFSHAIGNPVDRVAIAHVHHNDTGSLDTLTDGEIAALEVQAELVTALTLDKSEQGEETL